MLSDRLAWVSLPGHVNVGPGAKLALNSVITGHPSGVWHRAGLGGALSTAPQVLRRNFPKNT